LQCYIVSKTNTSTGNIMEWST